MTDQSTGQDVLVLCGDMGAGSGAGHGLQAVAGREASTPGRRPSQCSVPVPVGERVREL